MPRCVTGPSKLAQAMDVGARRQDRRPFDTVVNVRVGLEMIDQADIGIDAVANAGVTENYGRLHAGNRDR